MTDTPQRPALLTVNEVKAIATRMNFGYWTEPMAWVRAIEAAVHAKLGEPVAAVASEREAFEAWCRFKWIAPYSPGVWEVWQAGSAFRASVLTRPGSKA